MTSSNKVDPYHKHKLGIKSLLLNGFSIYSVGGVPRGEGDLIKLKIGMLIWTDF